MDTGAQIIESFTKLASLMAEDQEPDKHFEIGQTVYVAFAQENGNFFDPEDIATMFPTFTVCEYEPKNEYAQYKLQHGTGDTFWIPNSMIFSNKYDAVTEFMVNYFENLEGFFDEHSKWLKNTFEIKKGNN